MKKTLVFLLAVALMIPILAGCESGPHQMDEDKGAVITMYMTDEMYDFDPAIAYTDDSAVKVLSLLYEGLMKVSSSGKVEKALAKEITYNKDKNTMQIELNHTKWSDGRDVTADDFVYAWKRILEPDFPSEACSMLFDVKNARAIRNGDMTIDDLGLAAIETYLIEVEFEGPIDKDMFLENLASIALVPLREDVVARNPYWSKRTSDIKTNGQFLLRKMIYGDYMVIERSSYYYRDVEHDEVLTKYVTPYRFYIQFFMDRDANMAAYENDEIYYMGEIPLAKRAEYKDKANVSDLLSTHSYFFNTDHKILGNKLVRQALSAAIDRKAIADLVVFAKPAEGLIPTGVFEKNSKTDFRKAGGSLLSETADTAKAKDLLKQAGVSGGSFSISVRKSDEVSCAIADYCAKTWNELGFNVTVKKLDKTYIEPDEESTVARWQDDLTTAYETGDFDVIAIDHQILSTDPFVTLAAFAKPFSGQAMDIEKQDFTAVPHVTGYDNEAYNELIESVFAIKEREGRMEKLHEAEAILMEDLPVMPIVVNQSAYLASPLLSGIKVSWYGTPIFTRMDMKNYNDYLPDTTEAEVTLDLNSIK